MTYQNIPFTRSETRREGPPTVTFDDQAASYARETEVVTEPEADAPTRIVSPAAPAAPQKKARRYKLPAQAFLSVRSLGDSAFFALVWGFLRLLRAQLQPELIAVVDFLLSPIMIAAIAVVLTTAASLLEAQTLERLRNVQADLRDQLAVEPEAVRSLGQKLRSLARLRNLTIIALVTYLLVSAV